MKIGILTLPLHINYGGYLQNYALQQVLLGLGHNPITINTREIPLSASQLFRLYVLFNLKSLFLRATGKDRNRGYYGPSKNRIIRELQNRVRAFGIKYINLTKLVAPQKEILHLCKENSFDAVVVGSDQVWRPKYVECLEAQFLKPITNTSVIKISYAASFGTSVWELDYSQTLRCKELLKTFKMVTVREQSGVNLCKNYLKKDAYFVLDPTLLLNKGDYIKLVNAECEPKHDGNLFCYILDQTLQKKNIIDYISEKQSLKQFSVNIPESSVAFSIQYIKKNFKKFENPSVTSWLRAFMDAELVIADSFHAVAFSIIFNKPFWVIGNRERGLDRFISILNTFKLSDRLIDESEYLNIDFSKPIDWNYVNSIKEQLSQKSIELLKNALDS